jgi:hypothetical protein
MSRLGGFTRPFSGYLFRPELERPRLFAITGEAATSRSRSISIPNEVYFDCVVTYMEYKTYNHSTMALFLYKEKQVRTHMHVQPRIIAVEL